MDGTGSRSCAAVDFDIRGVETSCSAARELVS